HRRPRLNLPHLYLLHRIQPRFPAGLFYGRLDAAAWRVICNMDVERLPENRIEVTMPDVLITENIIGAEMDELRRRFDAVFEPELWREPDKLLALIPHFRALIARNQTQVTREVIGAGSMLEVIARAGVGMDNVDLEAASRAGIVVLCRPEQNTNSVAELTIGLLLSLARMIPAADNDTKSGGWRRQRFIGVEILGKTLGVVGLGRIGGGAAIKARALGMEIIAYDPYVDPESLRAMEARARLTSF